MTGTDRTTGKPPLLAVVFSARSRPWSEIVEAGSDVCRFLWIVDSREPGVMMRVLRKFGHVIDSADRSAEDLIRLVHDEHPAGITSFFDTDLHRHAWLAAALGLPGPSVRTTARLTDKLLQRDALTAAGVPGPRFSAVREPIDEDELARLCDGMTFPLVLKPRSGTACRDVIPVRDADELARLLDKSAHPSQLILEEQMEDLGPDSAPYADRVSVDSIVSRGVVSHMGVSGLFPVMPPFRSSGGFFPADIPPGEVEQLFGLTTASLRALHADFGCYRTEIKFTPQGYKIIEVNGRPSGITPVNVKLASGLPILEMCMRLALGEHIAVEGPVACDRVAYRYYCEPPMSAEKYVGSAGLDKLGEMPGVVAIDVHKMVGDPVDWHNGSLDKVFQVTGVVADHRELAEHYRACTSDVVVTYEHRRDSTHPSVPVSGSTSS